LNAKVPTPSEFLRFAERVGMIKPRRTAGDEISIQIGTEP
jgi:hypothetical protein